jgi:hypothetical protein
MLQVKLTGGTTLQEHVHAKFIRTVDNTLKVSEGCTSTLNGRQNSNFW